MAESHKLEPKRKRKRLNSTARKRKSINPHKLPLTKAEQVYAYIAVLDFEATCDKACRPKPQEIIEFPVVIVDSSTGTEISRFHKYVRPTHHPRLSSFCTELTGIEQPTVDAADDFNTVWKAFSIFMADGGYTAKNTIFVICGDWDLLTMMPRQANLGKIKVPSYFSKWINIKQLIKKKWRFNCKGMMGILQKLKIQHVGRHHSGIDDALNLVSCVRYMLDRGVVFEQTFPK